MLCQPTFRPLTGQRTRVYSRSNIASRDQLGLARPFRLPRSRRNLVVRTRGRIRRRRQLVLELRDPGRADFSRSSTERSTRRSNRRARVRRVQARLLCRRLPRSRRCRRFRRRRSAAPSAYTAATRRHVERCTGRRARRRRRTFGRHQRPLARSSGSSGWTSSGKSGRSGAGKCVGSAAGAAATSGEPPRQHERTSKPAERQAGKALPAHLGTMDTMTELLLPGGNSHGPIVRNRQPTTLPACCPTVLPAQRAPPRHPCLRAPTHPVPPTRDMRCTLLPVLTRPAQHKQPLSSRRPQQPVVRAAAQQHTLCRLRLRA